MKRQTKPDSAWAKVVNNVAKYIYLLIDKGKVGPCLIFSLLGLYGIILIRLPSEKLSEHVKWLQVLFQNVPFVCMGLMFVIVVFMYDKFQKERRTYQDRIKELADKKAEYEEEKIPNRRSSKSKRSKSLGE